MTPQSKQAADYFSNSFNCAQSVFTPFGTTAGIPEDQCLKISCAFGGGMGRQQLTCGAVTGAMMALGIHFGKAMGDDEAKKKETYAKTLVLFRSFIAKHGTVNCRELMNGLDMNDPEDKKKIEELNLHKNLCTGYVTDAVMITEEIIREE
jgi:C_GCAxxG_C_C family probable redox protein